MALCFLKKAIYTRTIILDSDFVFIHYYYEEVNFTKFTYSYYCEMMTNK